MTLAHRLLVAQPGHSSRASDSRVGPRRRRRAMYAAAPAPTIAPRRRTLDASLIEQLRSDRLLALTTLVQGRLQVRTIGTQTCVCVNHRYYALAIYLRAAAGGQGCRAAASRRCRARCGSAEVVWTNSHRVGAPENFAVDDEARHAEDAAGHGFIGVLAQQILDLRAASAGSTLEFRGRAGKARGVGGVFAGGPDRNRRCASRRVGSQPAASARRRCVQRVEGMRGGKAEGKAEPLALPRRRQR